LGVKELILSGYTPYPKHTGDERLVHLADKTDRQIAKTALGAEKSLKWHHSIDFSRGIEDAKKQGYKVYGLEQAPNSIAINEVTPNPRSVIIVGNELIGLEKEVLELCDEVIEIPMLGKKESFNVVQAAAMALFYFRLQ
jgi:tRNA G18 (ribose-2'-O)-methylase SpoU